MGTLKSTTRLVPPRILCDDVARAVGGAVVDDDDLDPVGRIVQGQHGIQRRADDDFLIVSRDQDGDRGVVEGLLSMSAVSLSERR